MRRQDVGLIYVLFVSLSGTGSSSARVQLPQALSTTIVGGSFTYIVQRNDSLVSVGARFGVGVSTLAKVNGLSSRAWLKEGQTLLVDNRHIVPERLDDGIVINVPQRMLFLFASGVLVRHYPVGLGRPDWRTATGEFTVMGKERNKVWYVPKSIQEEMRREGKPVTETVPPGPENPLGEYWIRISPNRGIHGTIYPASIYGFHTHGCIRLHPDDIADLYSLVRVGMPVKIIYKPVLVANLQHAGVYVEAHRDIYRLGGDPLDAVRALTAAAGVDPQIDEKTLRVTVRDRQGICRLVSCKRMVDEHG